MGGAIPTIMEALLAWGWLIVPLGLALGFKYKHRGLVASVLIGCILIISVSAVAYKMVSPAEIPIVPAYMVLRILPYLLILWISALAGLLLRLVLRRGKVILRA